MAPMVNSKLMSRAGIASSIAWRTNIGIGINVRALRIDSSTPQASRPRDARYSAM